MSRLKQAAITVVLTAGLVALAGVVSIGIVVALFTLTPLQVP